MTRSNLLLIPTWVQVPSRAPSFWTNFWLFAFLRLQSEIRHVFFSLCPTARIWVSHTAVHLGPGYPQTRGASHVQTGHSRSHMQPRLPSALTRPLPFSAIPQVITGTARLCVYSARILLFLLPPVPRPVLSHTALGNFRKLATPEFYSLTPRV